MFDGRVLGTATDLSVAGEEPTFALPDDRGMSCDGHGGKGWGVEGK